MDMYYRDGTYGNCPALFARWRTCLNAKLSKPEQAAQLLQDEQHATANGHLFRFRETFATEANERYGVSASWPTET